MQKVMMMKNKNGFTLVEVMAVITLLGVITILLIPTFQKVFNQTKSAIKDFDKQTLIDGGRMYAEHIFNGGTSEVVTKTYDDQCNVVNTKTETKPASYVITNQELSGYELIKYAALNDLYVTAEYLVDNGYYDSGCDYHADGKCNKSKECKVSKDCTLRIHFEHTTVKANPSCTLGDKCMVYYQLGQSSVSIVDESKCEIK